MAPARGGRLGPYLLATRAVESGRYGEIRKLFWYFIRIHQLYVVTVLIT